MEIKPGRKIFFPTNDLRQTIEAIQSLLHNTVGEDHKPIVVPKYVTREYIGELVASVVNSLIMQGSDEQERKAIDSQLSRVQ